MVATMPNEPSETYTATITYSNGSTQTLTFPVAASAVKAVGDWELDVLAVPFGAKDSDGQWFDGDTDIMHEAFSTPVAIYQHGVQQGAKGYQDKPIVIGSTVPGSLEKKGDGWHLRVVLNKALKQAKDIMDAAWLLCRLTPSRTLPGWKSAAARRSCTKRTERGE
jgi:hypothetical protein